MSQLYREKERKEGSLLDTRCLSKYVPRKLYTVQSQFNESQFNVKSQFKERNLMTKMKFRFKKSRFSVKSQFKE